MTLTWKSLAAWALLPAALLGGPRGALADTREYPIGYFADEFRATVAVEDSSDVFRPGTVSVFARRTGKRLLQVQSSELAFEVNDGRVAPNVKEVPYGRQSVLIYEDFDFDGRPDLAIMDGQNSCYHGPSFQVFLRRGATFVKSAAFTRLAQEYCGMFGVDPAAKRLSAMTKSGCCWHQFDSFQVIDGAPRLLESVVESQVEVSSAYLRRETSGRRTMREYLLLPPEQAGSRLLLAFDLAGPRRRHVEVFASDGLLDYALVVGPDRRVELSYQLHVLGNSEPRNPVSEHRFSWDERTGQLSFQSASYRYVIHDAPGRLGVSVQGHGRPLFMPAVAKTRNGTLRGLEAHDFENVEARTSN